MAGLRKPHLKRRINGTFYSALLTINQKALLTKQIINKYIDKYEFIIDKHVSYIPDADGLLFFRFFSDSGDMYTCGMFVCVSCVVCGLGCISRMYVKIGYTIIPLDCDLLIK